MGFSLGKLVKGVFKGIKKVFKAVGKGLKKIWKSKLGKILIIGGALVAGAWALGAFSASAPAASGILGQASALGKGGQVVAAGADVALGQGATSAATGAALGKGGQLVTAATDAALSGSAVSTTGILGGLKTAGGMIADGVSKVGGFMAANPALTTVAGMGLSGAMQAKGAQQAEEDARNYAQGLRNKETVYGLSYDGTVDQQPQGAAALARLNQNYYNNNQANTNILGGPGTPNAPQAVAPTRQKKRFNAQTNQWEDA